MSPMAEMSRAIRQTVERYSSDGTLDGTPREVLVEFEQIMTAYLMDLRGALKRAS